MSDEILATTGSASVTALRTATDVDSAAAAVAAASSGSESASACTSESASASASASGSLSGSASGSVSGSASTPVSELAARRWPGHSVLVVPVAPLEPLVRERTRYYDDAYLSADPTFAHAHVTLLGPFVDAGALTPAVRADVGRVLRRHRPFTARFEDVAQFPDGMIHLLPRDEEPFRRLTIDLAATFPDHPPYAGRHRDPRPHVTLDRVGADIDVAVVRGWVRDLVPVRVGVSEVQLSWYEQDGCHTLATWPLGDSDPSSQSGWSRPTATAARH